jgi:hypothetical protein
MNRTRSVCEKEVRALCQDWLHYASLCEIPPEAMDFDDFYSWLSRRYPQCICFKPSPCVAHWVRLWFDQEIEMAIRYTLSELEPMRGRG